MSKGLTDQQRRFADGVLKGKTQRQAYEDAGYKARGASADSKAARLVRNGKVAEYLAEKRAKIAAKTEVSVERVLMELARIGFADIRDLFTWDEERACYIPSRNLTEDQAAAISAVESESRTFTDEDGNRETTVKLKLKTYDKLGALEKIGKHLRMFIDRTQNYEFDPDDFTDEGLQRIEKGEDPVHVLVTGGRRARDGDR